MAVCCKIENVVSQVRSGIFNLEMFGWKRLSLFDLTSMLREKKVGRKLNKIGDIY